MPKRNCSREEGELISIVSLSRRVSLRAVESSFLLNTNFNCTKSTPTPLTIEFPIIENNPVIAFHLCLLSSIFLPFSPACLTFLFIVLAFHLTSQTSHILTFLPIGDPNIKSYRMHCCLSTDHSDKTQVQRPIIECTFGV